MKRTCLICIALLWAFFPVHALFISDATWGYALDLPEDFSLIDGNGKDRYLFRGTVVPVDFIIALYQKTAHPNVTAAAELVLLQTGAEGKLVKTNWRRNQCAIGQFTMKNMSSSFSGWIAGIELKDGKGFGVFMVLTPEDQALQYENVLISCLDSIGIDEASWHETGPMTAFAFQNEGSITKTISIGGKNIAVTLDKVDGEANQFIVDREFGVLTLYAKSPLWKEAWQRYYRLVYRDAYARLANASSAIQNAFSDSQNSYELANLLLGWTQGFSYERAPEGSDFTSLPDLLLGKGGDCDSRSLLLAVLLRHMGYDALIFISPEYSHSVAGIAVEGQGARMESDGTQYLIGETTAKVQLGLIAQNLANPDKWIAVPLYDISKL